MPQSPRATVRQAAVLTALLAESESAVAAGRPLDALLAEHFRAHREYGSRDRRLFAEALFSYFRWRGALDHAGLAEPAARLAAAGQLDGHAEAPALAHLWSAVAEGPALVARLRAVPAAALVPDWLPAALLIPDGVERAPHVARVIDSLQRRPPTWLRCRPGRRDDVLAALVAAGAEPFPHAHQPEAIGLRRSVPLAELHRRTGAAFEVQDAASQTAVSAASPAPGEAW